MSHFISFLEVVKSVAKLLRLKNYESTKINVTNWINRLEKVD